MEPTTQLDAGRIQHAHPADLAAHQRITVQRINRGTPTPITSQEEEALVVEEEVNPNAAAYVALLEAFPHTGECMQPQTKKQRDLARSPHQRRLLHSNPRAE